MPHPLAHPATVEIMAAIVATTVIVIVTTENVIHDDDPPAVTGVRVHSVMPGCASVRENIDIHVSDPTFWYQDDTGVKRVDVDGQVWTFPKEFFTVVTPLLVTKNECATPQNFSVVSHDHAGNSTSGTVTLTNQPLPHCCAPTPPASCDCSNFQGQGSGPGD